MTRPGPDGDSAAGFTLVEVLVAFFIAALTLSMALRVLGEGAGWARRGPAAALRMDEAASLLDTVLAEPHLRTGERGGIFTDGRRWRVRVTDVTDRVVPAAPGRLMRVEMFDGAASRTPLLATLAIVAARPR